MLQLFDVAFSSCWLSHIPAERFEGRSCDSEELN